MKQGRNYQAEYRRRMSTPQGRARLAAARRNQGDRNATRARERYAEQRHGLIVFAGPDDVVTIACKTCTYRTSRIEVTVADLVTIQADHRKDVW